MTCHERPDGYMAHPLQPVLDDQGRIVRHRCECGQVDTPSVPPRRTWKEGL